MRPISIKLDEEIIEAIDDEAEDRDLTRSQYLRRIIDARHDQPDQTEHKSLSERVSRLEKRLDQRDTETEIVTTKPINEARTTEPEPAPKGENEIDTTDEIVDAVDAAAESWDDSPDRLEARKAAARAALTAIREEPRSKSEILDEVEPRHSVEGQSKRTWWRANLSESNPSPLKELCEFSNATKKWQFTGQ